MPSNPILKNLRNFFSYFFVWLIITVAYILVLVYGEKISLGIALADGLIFNVLLASFGLSFWYSARYISFELSSIPKILISHTIGGVTSVSLWLAMGFFITNSLASRSEEYSTFFLNNIGWRILVGILYYFLVISFYYLVIYYNNFHEKTLRENELKNLVTQAELKSLKFQINPHFIFNSLNSMSALTTIDSTKARSMILKLADFLRYTLVNNDRQKNKLSEELNNIKLYLEFEKVTLKFKSFIQNDFLNISLENNFDSSSGNKSGSGIGLNNIGDRLKLIYGLNNLMNVEKTESIFKVNLYIPLSK